LRLGQLRLGDFHRQLESFTLPFPASLAEFSFPLRVPCAQFQRMLPFSSSKGFLDGGRLCDGKEISNRGSGWGNWLSDVSAPCGGRGSNCTGLPVPGRRRAPLKRAIELALAERKDIPSGKNSGESGGSRRADHNRRSSLPNLYARFPAQAIPTGIRKRR